MNSVRRFIYNNHDFWTKMFRNIRGFLIFSGPTDCHGTKLRFTICSLDIFAFQVIHPTRGEVFDLEKKQLEERLKNEAKVRFLKRS